MTPAENGVPASPDGQPGPERARPSAIRILLAEDARVVRETLAALLDLEADIQVAAAAASGDQVVASAVERWPDVALLDIGLLGMDGITAAAALAGLLPGCKVLIVTGLEAPGNLEAALWAGVRGFLLKDRPSDELIGGVRAVARGEGVIEKAAPVPEA